MAGSSLLLLVLPDPPRLDDPELAVDGALVQSVRQRLHRAEDTGDAHSARHSDHGDSGVQAWIEVERIREAEIQGDETADLLATGLDQGRIVPAGDIPSLNPPESGFKIKMTVG